MADENDGPILTLEDPQSSQSLHERAELLTLAKARISNSRRAKLELWSERILLDVFPCNWEG